MSCNKHYNWTTDTPCPYCRIDELEQQLAALKQVSAELCPDCGWAMKFPDEPCCKCEVERLKEESSHLWVRIESGEAAAYEQGKAEARKQAAREILDSLTQEEIRRITSVGDPRVTTISSKLLAMMAELRQRYGLEG